MRRREVVRWVAGAAIAWPLAGHAQQKPVPVIGYLSVSSPDTDPLLVDAFRAGFGDTGYVEGRNAAIEYRWAEGDYDLLPALAADLVDRHVDVIATNGGNIAIRTAKAATSTIPIVFVGGADPVEDGLVSSFARPGGNVTGVTFITSNLTSKRLELLVELVPPSRGVTMLVNPRNPTTESVVAEAREAARAKHLEIDVLNAATGAEIDAAFATLGAGKTVRS